MHIANKIAAVSDDLCLRCPQCWQDECRAFLLPHSRAEAEHRQIGGALCQNDGLGRRRNAQTKPRPAYSGLLLEEERE